MNEQFPSTIWSKLLTGNADSYLARNYWKPIFHFIKSVETKEDPEDLTQEFLVQCLSKGFLDKVKVAKDKQVFSFRSYLKASLKNFLTNRREWRNAKKRKNDFNHLSFHEERDIQIPLDKTPENIFDYVWAKELMSDCYRILRVALGEEFSIFYSFYLGEHKMSLKELAKEQNTSEQRIDYILKKGRKQLQNIVVDELKKIVTGKEDLQKEMLFLKEALLE